MTHVEQIINELELIPHPEGGFYKETYRSEGSIESSMLNGFDGDRSFCTAIYFMLTKGTFSAFHKIKSDEMWHHYDGAAIELHMISPKGKHSIIIIGKDFSNGEHPQYVVPGGCWFASRVKDEASFSLLGCTVSPGFDFSDFVLPTRKEFTVLFPQHAEVIAELTHR
ncbi:MAG: cupin domain-containing protein [Crocinitomicaceae bacterium]